ncbi:MAG: hypothetical protein ACPGU1_05380 [Myxococcota bacterium]
MTTGRLLRYRVTALKRRIAGPRTMSGALVVLLALSAVAATVWAVWGWASGDVDAGDESFAMRIGDRVFWLSALPVLVFAYTTFEVIFRAPDGAFIALLPVDGQARWMDLQLRAYTVHAPLLLPAFTYAATIFEAGQTAGALRLLAVAGSAYVVGIALCSWLHLMAGRTMLRVATPLSRSLAGAAIDDDAALILYAPAAGLGLTLVLIVFLDILASRALQLGGQPEVLTVTVALLLMAAVWIVRRAAVDARGCLTLVISRFQEVDTPLPYRDDGIPEETPGEGLAARLSRSTAALFLRDLLQLRRRHRLDRILLWLFAALALRAGLTNADNGDALLSELLTLYVAFVGLFWTNAFRLHGQELGSPWMATTLPLKRAAQRRAGLLIDLTMPGWALLWVTLATLIAQQWLHAPLVLGIGVMIAIISALLSRAIATWMDGYSTAAAIAWRASVIVLIALAPGGTP